MAGRCIRRPSGPGVRFQHHGAESGMRRYRLGGAGCCTPVAERQNSATYGLEAVPVAAGARIDAPQSGLGTGSDTPVRRLGLVQFRIASPSQFVGWSQTKDLDVDGLAGAAGTRRRPESRASNLVGRSRRDPMPMDLTVVDGKDSLSLLSGRLSGEA